MDFERAQHPFYEKHGPVKALETIKFSVATHRGCYGECNFCSIAVHQGRTVRWRSEASVVREVERLTQHPDFKGYIQDVGGPTANMYGFECKKKTSRGSCDDKRCLYPDICPQLTIDHGKQLTLLKRLRRIKGVKKVFVASGIRHDLVLADQKFGLPYMTRRGAASHFGPDEDSARAHRGPRPAPDGKTGQRTILQFRDLFYKLTKSARKEQFLTYYLIAAHPGCTERDMQALKRFASRHLKINPSKSRSLPQPHPPIPA